MRPEHPVFAWFYEAMNRPGEYFGDKMRARLVGRLDGRILEVGAGNGLSFSHYAGGASVVAMEPDPHMLRRAVARARSARAAVALVEGDGQVLPFKAASFDAIVACLVLCTIPDASGALAEMRRVLRPGGRLYFIEHVRADGPWIARVQDAVDPVWARTMGGCHPNRDTRAALDRSGFRVHAIKTAMRGVVIEGVAVAA